MANGASSSINRERWTQLIAGIICMIMIANLQYGWTLFVHPINAAHGWSIAAIQVGFSIFVALETWLTPIEGWIVDKLGAQTGPKLMVAFGGVMIALGWILCGRADSLTMLYIGSALTGIGGGAVYATCVGQAVKWFPDKRGLAVGLTAAGFGAGAALTVVPIRAVIASSGYATAFFWFGLVQGVVVFLLAWLLRAPEPGEMSGFAQPKVMVTGRSYTPAEALMSPVFWVLYVMFILVAASGLMATAQVALIARDYNVANVAVIGGATALSVALIIDNIANGAARPLFGWVSDHIGREYTMAIAFGLGAISYWLLGSAGGAPWAFVIFAALIFLTWGEIFSLSPSTCTDSFGPKFATVNLSLLYTAKGAAAFLVPLANVIKASTGSWHMVFVVTAIMNLVVVGLALFVLKPLRNKTAASEGQLAHA
jgi:OFA family oxalate/formate antiporter-like MFS transporter